MHFPAIVIHDPPLGRALHQLHSLLEQPGCALAQESFALVTGAQLVHRHSMNGPSLPDSSDGRRAVQHAREYLDEHCDQNVSLASLAGLTGLNPFQLLRLFHRHVGVPPHEYLLQVRINRAKKLLLEGQTPVDAALATGFFDQSHLCRHFHRLVGVTPAQYRNAHHAA